MYIVWIEKFKLADLDFSFEVGAIGQLEADNNTTESVLGANQMEHCPFCKSCELPDGQQADLPP